MNYLVLIAYRLDRRHVGPFPSRDLAMAWAEQNVSPLWVRFEVVPLEAPSLYVVPQHP